MISTILLIRHGQTDGNVNEYFTGLGDADLNEEGFKQVKELSARLSLLPLSAVYSSPLRRTLATAEMIAEPHGISPQIVDDLIEIDLGDWQGLHKNQVEERWPELRKQSLIDPSHITLPNGESFSQVTERAIRALNTIESFGEEHMAVVTHEVIVKVLVAYVLGVSNSIYRKLDISNASVTTVNVDESNRRLITLNDISHL